jgi:predicted MPP superfamily phosphohydrolase
VSAPSRIPPVVEGASRIEVRRFGGPALHRTQLATPIRIAHLTDLHVGRVTPRRVHEDAVALTNAARPDVVVLTGDFVCHSQLYLDELFAVVVAFDAPVFAVLGNHDHWAGADEVRRALEHAGACVLDNAHTSITVRHERLQVVGVDDSYTGHADVDRALKGLDPRRPTLALSHIAEEADHFWARGVPLVLSGHTHGGQITLAKLHEILLGRVAGHRYVHGLYGDRAASGAVYVGAGIGASVMPLRVGDRGRREIALFDLGSAPAHDEHHREQLPLKGRAPSARRRALRQLAVAKKASRRRVPADPA